MLQQIMQCWRNKELQVELQQHGNFKTDNTLTVEYNCWSQKWFSWVAIIQLFHSSNLAILESQGDFRWFAAPVLGSGDWVVAVCCHTPRDHARRPHKRNQNSASQAHRGQHVLGNFYCCVCGRAESSQAHSRQQQWCGKCTAEVLFLITLFLFLFFPIMVESEIRNL